MLTAPVINLKVVSIMQSLPSAGEKGYIYNGFGTMINEQGS